ncbi:MAG: hypothetical protein HC935_10965 [Pseudanabaena sp. SU_2_4]|nr:hypothetical protein [Pseudanabaena sp. SU_2_4]
MAIALCKIKNRPPIHPQNQTVRETQSRLKPYQISNSLSQKDLPAFGEAFSFAAQRSVRVAHDALPPETIDALPLLSGSKVQRGGNMAMVNLEMDYFEGAKANG